MRQRNARVRRSAKRCRDAGYADVRDSVSVQDLDLFAAAAEHERVSAFQACDSQSFAGVVHEQLAYPVLHRVIANLLTDENPLSIASRPLEHGIGYEPIVENHVRLL